MGGGGQKILVCEPQKSAFFRAHFPKNMLKLIHNVPFGCLYKIQSFNSFKIPDVGFHLCILPFKIMWETGWCRLAWVEVGALCKIGLLVTNLCNFKFSIRSEIRRGRIQKCEDWSNFVKGAHLYPCQTAPTSLSHYFEWKYA